MAVVQLLLETLECVVCVMENPATRMLPGREVRHGVEKESEIFAMNLWNMMCNDCCVGVMTAM